MNFEILVHFLVFDLSMHLPVFPFRLKACSLLGTTPASLFQPRHASASQAMRMATGFTKNKEKTAKTSGGNPFLQGRNFDKEDAKVKLSRMMLFAHKPAMRGLGLNPQDKIRHETIHRAWLLFQKQRRREKMRRLCNLQESVHKTMKVLFEIDNRLYDIAVTGTREGEKRFPLVMRMPTNTLRKKFWNYGWNAFNIKGIGGVAKPG